MEKDYKCLGWYFSGLICHSERTYIPCWNQRISCLLDHG